MSPKSIPSSQLLDALRWRYATKAFDANRKISANVWSALEEIYAVMKTEGELHAQLRG